MPGGAGGGWRGRAQARRCEFKKQTYINTFFKAKHTTHLRYMSQLGGLALGARGSLAGAGGLFGSFVYMVLVLDIWTFAAQQATTLPAILPKVPSSRLRGTRNRASNCNYS